jgi:osmotically-inducible protein OsmY
MAEHLGHVRGVRGVSTRIRFPADPGASDRGDERRLAQLLGSVSAADAVTVAFFGGVAVLSGTARSLRAKGAIEAFVADDSAVERVVNKIEVASTGEGAGSSA